MPRRGASGSVTGSGCGPVLDRRGRAPRRRSAPAGHATGRWSASDHHGEPAGVPADCPAAGGWRQFQPSVTSVPPLVPGEPPSPLFQDDTDRRRRSGIDGPVRAPERALLLSYPMCTGSAPRIPLRRRSSSSPQPARSAPRPAQSLVFAEAYAAEDIVLQTARSLAHELGLTAVSPGAGSVLRLLAAAGSAKAVVEIGTGTGRQRRLAAARHARRRRADHDRRGERAPADRPPDLRRGRASPPSRTRIITGRALDVLPRLADGVYDLVFVDADATEFGACADAALRLLRPGGVLIVNGALAGGRIGDPAARDAGHGDDPRDAQDGPRVRGLDPGADPVRRRAAGRGQGACRALAASAGSGRPSRWRPWCSSPSVVVGPGRRGHVEVRPAVTLSPRNSLQVERRDHRSRAPRRGAVPVGDVAAQVLDVVVGQRHPPHPLAGRRSGRGQRRGQRRRRGCTGRRSACRAPPRSRRSAWPGRAPRRARARRTAYAERVGQHQPALGVGVGALAGGAVVVA